MAEADTNNDVVIEDFQDSYSNLTLKSTFMLKWLTARCSHARFVLKVRNINNNNNNNNNTQVDDDVYVNLDNLLIALQSTPMNSARPDFANYSLIGRTMINISPVRDPKNKWFLSKTIFPADKFPSYLIGMSYGFTGNLIYPIYTCALRQVVKSHFHKISPLSQIPHEKRGAKG